MHGQSSPSQPPRALGTPSHVPAGEALYLPLLCTPSCFPPVVPASFKFFLLFLLNITPRHPHPSLSQPKCPHLAKPPSAPLPLQALHHLVLFISFRALNTSQKHLISSLLHIILCLLPLTCQWLENSDLLSLVCYLKSLLPSSAYTGRALSGCH